MEIVNRFALIVRPKRRFLEWANALDLEGPRLTIESLPGLTEVHLVEATFEAPDREALIDEYADAMWEQFLFGWSTDEDTWPQNRTAHTFRDWFDVTVVDGVFDADADSEWDVVDDAEDDVENALTECAWCGAQIDDEQEVATLFMTLAENDPIKFGENEVILVPVGGRDRRAVVARPGSDMAREGRDLAFTMCSERCAKAMKNVLERERSAQLS